MTKNNTAQSGENVSRSEPNLDSRYGEIGISAVVAALQFQSVAKDPCPCTGCPRAGQMDRGDGALSYQRGRPWPVPRKLLPSTVRFARDPLGLSRRAGA